MKISRRKFIQLGVSALAMLGLANGEQGATPAEIECAEMFKCDLPMMTAKEKQLTFIDQVLDGKGNVWPTPIRYSCPMPSMEQAGYDTMTGFISGIKISDESISELAEKLDEFDVRRWTKASNIEIKDQEYVELESSLGADNKLTFEFVLHGYESDKDA